MLCNHALTPGALHKTIPDTWADHNRPPTIKYNVAGEHLPERVCDISFQKLNACRKVKIACLVKTDPILHLNVAMGKLSEVKSFHQHTVAKTRFYQHYLVAGQTPGRNHSLLSTITREAVVQFAVRQVLPPLLRAVTRRSSACLQHAVRIRGLTRRIYPDAFPGVGPVAGSDPQDERI